MMKQCTFDHTRMRICLDALDVENLSGRLYNMTLSDPISFHDLGKMVIDADKLFDEIGSPQSFQERRTFGSASKKHTYQFHPKERMKPEDFYAQSGAVLTFDFVVETRQYTGLQGRVYNAENIEIGKFTNETELLRIILELIEKN